MTESERERERARERERERERGRERETTVASSSFFFMMQLFFFIHTAGTRHAAPLGSCAAFRCLLAFVLLPGSRQCSSLPHSNTHCMACWEKHSEDEASFHTFRHASVNAQVVLV